MTSHPARGYLSSGAVFDKSESYRYLLWRSWRLELPLVTFVMLNPNSADAIRDDPTIRRCIGFARAWGYGGIDVVNVFGYRARSPADLNAVVDPVGPANRKYLERACVRASIVVAAWGNGIRSRSRAGDSLVGITEDLFCLGRTRHGQPKHPLYLRSNVLLEPYALDL